MSARATVALAFAANDDTGRLPAVPGPARARQVHPALVRRQRLDLAGVHDVLPGRAARRVRARLCDHAAAGDPAPGAGAGGDTGLEPPAPAHRALRRAGSRRRPSDPTWRILGLLAVCVAVPYIALATTTPLLSRWLAHIEPTLNPVRFFAASNVGSFLGLLTYPFFFERLLTSPQQARWWSWAYVLYAALFVLCGWLTLAALAPMATARSRRRTSIAGADDPWLLWVAYSAPRLGAAGGHHKRHHAMVGGGALPVGRAAERLPPDVHRHLCLSARVPSRRLRQRFPAACRFRVPAARAGIFVCLFHAARAAGGDAFRRLHDLPRRAGQVAAGAGAIAEVLPRRGGGRRAGRHSVVLPAPLLFSDYFEHPLVLATIAAVALVHMLPRARRAGRRWARRPTILAGVFFLGGLAAGCREEVTGNPWSSACAISTAW